jgi:hypothetical protein
LPGTQQKVGISFSFLKCTFFFEFNIRKNQGHTPLFLVPLAFFVSSIKRRTKKVQDSSFVITRDTKKGLLSQPLEFHGVPSSPEANKRDLSVYDGFECARGAQARFFLGAALSAFSGSRERLES